MMHLRCIPPKNL